MPHVVFLNVPAHGHVNPTLGVVAELVRRGATVTYHCGEPYRSVVETAGAAFRAYQAEWIDVDMPHDGDVLGLARVVREAEAKIAPALLPLLKAERPDVIVHDSLATWGKTLAATLGIPAVSSLTTFVFDRRVALARPLLFARFVARHARDPVHLHEIPSVLDAITSREDTNLVYTSRAFQPFGDSFDERFVFVGPVMRDEPPLDTDLAALEHPIYVSLGTLFNDDRALFRAAAAALADLGHPVVISTGGRLDPADLGAMAANVSVRRWVPQLALLRRAVLAVTHGGMNTVNEALLFGVPLVVVPQAADQPWVARRVSQLGAGVTVNTPTAASLRDAAQRALAASVRDAAARIGETLRSAGGAARAANAILAAMAKARTD